MSMMDIDQLTKGAICWIREWFEKHGSPTSKAVIGISGGKDSSVVAGLCVKALGADRVYGVLMPNGEQSDISDSIEVCEHLGVDHEIVNIHDTCLSMESDITVGVRGQILTQQTLQNYQPRIRMTLLYGIAQTIDGYVSCNTNLCEAFVGYGTIYGDLAGAFAPLLQMPVSDVVRVGKKIGIPDHLVEKSPADGLTGKTDEDNFGFTYDQLESVIYGVCDDKELVATILAMNKRTEFKRKQIDYFNPNWVDGYYFNPKGTHTTSHILM